MKSLCGKSIAPTNWEGDYICCSEGKLVQEARQSWFALYGEN